MLTSKQRARLSALAQTLDPILHLGKLGSSDGFKAAFDKALSDHELIKLRFVDFLDGKREVALDLAESAEAELVRVIGNTAVFYRQNADPKKRKVEL